MNRIDLLIMIFTIIISVIILECDNEGGKAEEQEERSIPDVLDKICYDAFRGLSKEEFARLPPELRQKVPDKCSFCRWMLECDPLEMAVATGAYCGGFENK